MNKMTDSKFNMWRACVAVTHLDGSVSLNERKWVEEKIQKLPLSPEQKEILARDLENPPKFEECFQKVTDKVDLGFLVNTMRVVSYLDKDFSPAEKQKFSEIEKSVLSNLDLDKVSVEVEEIRRRNYKDQEILNKDSIFEAIFRAFENFIK